MAREIEAPTPRLRPVSALRAFVHGETAGGFVLIAAAALALAFANIDGLAIRYRALLAFRTGPVLDGGLRPMTVHLWIDDGLMAVFFLLVGLEIKRELVDGRLSTADRRRLPFIAAATGMAAPAIVFLAVAGTGGALSHGWAIPAATDIAFAMGVLSLLGHRVPSTLKLLLMTIAIVDDMGAVAIIALVYTAQIHLFWLVLAGMAFAALYVLNRRGVGRLAPYVAGFALGWLFLLMSGVHATVAGVVTAALVPFRPSPAAPDDATSALHRLETRISPWVAYAIVPLFAFANAGVPLRGLTFATLGEPLVLGIALGLFVGKQAGVFGGIYAAVRLGIAAPPGNLTWLQIWGMALVAGIGFTMSLFIGGLAFADPALVDRVRIGVFAGSIASALLGFAVLAATRPRKP